MAKKEPLFVKIVIPAVKIMIVDRYFEKTIENYRYPHFSETVLRKWNIYGAELNPKLNSLLKSNFLSLIPGFRIRVSIW